MLDDSGSNFGIATFDNMILGFVTVFQMVTLEGWSDIMYNLMDASVPYIAVIFCSLVVVIGSFFLLNVVLAVIMEAFEDVDANAALAEARQKKEYKWLVNHFKITDDELSDDSEQQEEEKESKEVKSEEKKNDSIVGSAMREKFVKSWTTKKGEITVEAEGSASAPLK